MRHKLKCWPLRPKVYFSVGYSYKLNTAFESHRLSRSALKQRRVPYHVLYWPCHFSAFPLIWTSLRSYPISDEICLQFANGYVSYAHLKYNRNYDFKFILHFCSILCFTHTSSYLVGYSSLLRIHAVSLTRRYEDVQHVCFWHVRVGQNQSFNYGSWILSTHWESCARLHYMPLS